MPEIVVKFADRVIERVVTEKDFISIGRTSENDIVLDNRGISRRHARIEINGKEPEVIDLDSLNGTFVNQMKVTRQFLKDNDKITVGKFDLYFYRDSHAEAKMSDIESTVVNDTKRQRELTQPEKHNPLEGLMETRPIPVSLHSEVKTDRKEHR